MQAGSAERPTCYLLKVHVQLKLSCDGEAVLRAGSSAVAAARSLSSRGGAAQAHVAELDVFSEEEPAFCEHRRHHVMEALKETCNFYNKPHSKLKPMSPLK